MKRFLILFFLLFLTGCDALRQVNLPIAQTLAAVPLPGMKASPTPTLVATLAPPVTQPAPTPSPANSPAAAPTLTVWVPPQFAPDASTPGGLLLAKRLQEFSRANNGVRVQVRVKAETGPGGLLESLDAANAAAPLALPAVVALNRADLETAALKGMIFALDTQSKVMSQPDWYPYARQLSKVQGGTFALPFAGDALVLAYRPGKINLNTPLADWTTLLRMNQTLGFPAGDPQALFALSLYQSLGGATADAQKRPTLQPDKLSQVLQLFSDGEQRGIFAYWLSQYETDGQVWQAYRDGRVNALVTWSSNYLTNLPADSAAVPVPKLGSTDVTLATGWGWAVADPLPERRALSVKLAEYLAQADFMATWTEADGYIPTRPSALTAWSNQSLKNWLSPVAQSAQTLPGSDQLSSLGPVLEDATLKVLKRESDPTQAAKAASEKLAVPEVK